MKDLKGKVAFVTGGSSGIGLGIVKVLAEQGMSVAFSYRSAGHRDQVMAYFRDRPEQRVYPFKLDVTNRSGFARAADEIEQALGPVQVLVNNAGIGVHGLIEHATYDDWDWIKEVNLDGVMNGVLTFLPRMLASDLDCHIVNVSSMGGVAALGSVGLYTTTKFAVVGLSEALRTDLIGRRVGVSAYCPGLVQSNIVESERGRPVSRSNTGYVSHNADGAPPPDAMAHAMDATEAGRYVLRGIQENALYIFSHPEFRSVLAARHNAILSAIPDEPVNAARAEAVRWILSNPIYDEGA